MAKQKKYVHGQAGGRAVFDKYGSEFFSKIASDAHKRRKRLARISQKSSLPAKKKSK